jgi:biopolymer transport protein ExbB
MRFFLVIALMVIGVSLLAQTSDEPPAADNSTADTPAATGEDSSTDANEDQGDTATDEEGTNDEGEEAYGDSDADTEEDSKSFFRSGALGLLLDGGVFMWPLVIMAILAAGVIVERFRSLQMVNTSDTEVKEAVQELLRNDKIEEALELCEDKQGPVPAVLSSGLRKYYVLKRLDYDAGRIETQVVKAMDDYSVHIVAALEKHLGILATISSAAPMLGFLGTVQGMIVAFRDIVAQMGETNIVVAAASGIQVSLLTTCFGLIVGIPAYIAFNYFTGIINRYVLEVEETASDLIESVTLQLAVSGDK